MMNGDQMGLVKTNLGGKEGGCKSERGKERLGCGRNSFNITLTEGDVGLMLELKWHWVGYSWLE